MRILLDENFPLALYDRLAAAGHEVEHIIVLGQRGASDADIRRRLMSESLLFLTQDEEFLSWDPKSPSTALISRVAQRRPIQERLTRWLSAIEEFLEQRPRCNLFEISDSGELLPWQTLEPE